jgi:DNA-binding response OmpR family regulator
VHHLRRKLLDLGATAEIHTVRGVGYILTESST